MNSFTIYYICMFEERFALPVRMCKLTRSNVPWILHSEELLELPVPTYTIAPYCLRNYIISRYWVLTLCLEFHLHLREGIQSLVHVQGNMSHQFINREGAKVIVNIPPLPCIAEACFQVKYLHQSPERW